MPEETRPNYQRELRDRVARFYTEELSNAETRADQLSRIYDFAKQVALESFKNGKEAGTRATRRPRTASANIKGTALENGKLKPVVRQ